MPFTDEILELCRRRSINPENLPAGAYVEITHGTTSYARLPVQGMIEGEIATNVRWYEVNLGLPEKSGQIHVDIFSS